MFAGVGGNDARGVLIIKCQHCGDAGPYGGTLKKALFVQMIKKYDLPLDIYKKLSYNRPIMQET